MAYGHCPWASKSMPVEFSNTLFPVSLVFLHRFNACLEVLHSIKDHGPIERSFFLRLPHDRVESRDCS